MYKNQGLVLRPSFVTLRGPPSWILKLGGLESSGWRLISSYGKTKRIANFGKSNLEKKKKKKIIFFFFVFFNFLTIFERHLIVGSFYDFFCWIFRFLGIFFWIFWILFFILIFWIFLKMFLHFFGFF